MSDDKIKDVSDAYISITKLIADTPDHLRPTLLKLVKRLILGIEAHEIEEVVALE